MRNTTTKIKRDMKKYIVLSLALFATDLFSDNSQELQSHFKNSDVNFRDSDGDGMTDYAELKYGYDPLDGSSNSVSDSVINSFIVEDNLKSYNFESTDTPRLLFSFSDVGFDEELKKRSKVFLKKVLPLLSHELGSPYKNVLCRIRRNKNSSAYSVNASGNSIRFAKEFRPSSIVHEILHSWRSSANLHGAGGMAWEEGLATGITSFITNEYLKCYPHDENSRALLNKRGMLGRSPYLFCSVDSLFDQSKFQKNLVGWNVAEDIWEYYQHSGAFFKLFRSVNESFTRDFHQEYFKRIRNGKKKSNKMVIDIISNLVPSINGIETTDFIESIPLFNGPTKLSNGFYAVMNRRGYVNYTPTIYPAYAKNQKFNWYTFDKTFDEVPTYTKPNGQIIPDLRNQPFQVDVKNVSGVREISYEGVSSNNTNENGGPSGNLSVKFPKLKPSNYEQGLYSVDIMFTNFTHTTKTPDSSYYMFGKKDLVSDIKNSFTIMIGIDSDSLVNQYLGECEINVNQNTYTTSLINNCAYFNLTDIPFDYTGQISISIPGPNVPQNFSGQKEKFIKRQYTRTLTNGGSTDGHRHYCFVLIDEDFDGVEDAYDSNITNLQLEWDALLEEMFLDEDHDVSVSESDNDSVIETNSEIQNEFLIQTQAESVVQTQAESVVETQAESVVQTQAESVVQTQAESVVETQAESVVETDVDLPTLQVETNTSIVIVADASDAFVDHTNDLIVEVNETLVIVENVLSVNAFDGTLQPTEDDNIIIVDSEVLQLYANDQTTNELNITDSIVTISNTEIIVDQNESDRNQRLISDATTPPSPPSLANAWDGCVEVAPGWFYLEWFGYFYKMPSNNWIYHETLGWLYADFTTTFDSVWIYHDTLGWKWTSQNVFPYMYNPDVDTWVYVSDIGYYDFKVSQWMPFK